MSDSTIPLNWPAIRRAALTLAGLAAACALVLVFGRAFVLGITQPSLAGADLIQSTAAFVAGPLFQWVLRAIIALLALGEGYLLAHELRGTGELALANAFVMGLAAMIGLVVLRAALDVLFAAPNVVQRIVVDAVLYVVSLGLALLGAWLGRRDSK